MSIERVNKHGIPIIVVKQNKVVITNPFYCSTQKCRNRARNKYCNGVYCDECYVKIIDYGNHAFD